MSTTPAWLVDCAGASIGGAARFLRELDLYLASDPGNSVEVIGRGAFLTPQWMIKRELMAHPFRHRIALNNVSFVGGENRTVLLRNALHFARPNELEVLRFRPSRTLLMQTQVVRAAAIRASRLVVPCSDMAERVARILPSVADRLEVRFHPVSVPVSAHAAEEGRILVPIVPSPYKNLDQHAANLLSALDHLGKPGQVVFTTQSGELPSAAGHPRAEFIGVQPADKLASEWDRCSAIYFPTSIESFGYPLAEARVRGKRVIGLNSAQNREIAGGALAPFESDDESSLQNAASAALTHQVAPDPDPFDRAGYFARLFESNHR